MQGTAKVHVYVQCILAFLSQSEKIYWNMHSKVPGQLEAKSFINPKLKILGGTVRDAEQLKYQLSWYYIMKKFQTLDLTVSILLDEMGLDEIGMTHIILIHIS